MSIVTRFTPTFFFVQPQEVSDPAALQQKPLHDGQYRKDLPTGDDLGPLQLIRLPSPCEAARPGRFHVAAPVGAAAVRQGYDEAITVRLSTQGCLVRLAAATSHVSEKRRDGMPLAGVLAPEDGIPFEDAKLEPVGVAPDDSGHYHRGRGHHNEHTERTCRDDERRCGVSPISGVRLFTTPTKPKHC
jgi:hypothetical protein